MIYPELPTTYVLRGLIYNKEDKRVPDLCESADLLSGWQETTTLYLWHWVTSAVQQACALPSFSPSQVRPSVISVSNSIPAVSPYPTLTEQSTRNVSLQNIMTKLHTSEKVKVTSCLRGQLPRTFMVLENFIYFHSVNSTSTCLSIWLKFSLRVKISQE